MGTQFDTEGHQRMTNFILTIASRLLTVYICIIVYYGVINFLQGVFS